MIRITSKYQSNFCRQYRTNCDEYHRQYENAVKVSFFGNILNILQE